MTIKTSPPGNDKKSGRHCGGYTLLSMAIAVIIGALAFATVAGSIALLVRNAATLKTGLFADMDRRNARAVEMKTEFSAE